MNRVLSSTLEPTVRPTPGPWHVHEGGNHVYVGADGYNEYIEREGYLGGPLCVAEVNYKATEDHSADHDKAMANGRVIAAAPDLLSALKALKLECLADHLNPCWDNRPSDKPGLHWGSEDGAPVLACSSCNARAAIAKAEDRA